MSDTYAALLALISSVRRRWRALHALRAWARAASVGAAVLAVALLVHWWLQPRGAALVFLWAAASLSASAALGRVAAASLRRGPADLQMARFIEERCPGLDDALVTAVSQGQRGSDGMTAAVLEDAVRRVRALDAGSVIGARMLRRAAVLAAAASLACVVVFVGAAGPMGQAGRTLALLAFPERIGLVVAPGSVKVRAGDSLNIVARLSSGAIRPVLGIDDGTQTVDVPMEESAGAYSVSLDGIDRDFTYAVTAAGASSPDYAVTVVHPPQVARIDLSYEYPASSRMQPRAEEDGGDIYGPAGTRVRITVYPSKPVRNGTLALAGGAALSLVPDGGVLRAELTIEEDDSYRVALADWDGLANPGDTEYFIRTLQDRPPDVRIVRPARDRQVTSIEEVSIEARADDDFGVAALDLVFAVGGGPPRVAPFARSGPPTAAAGALVLYLEDLGVSPGDVIAYYARASDVSRGKRSTETRSDIFFLEVTPFEEEFVASRSEGAGGGGGDGRTLEELIQAEKNIITATWNLDRRSRESGGRSNDDVLSVARGQADLRSRTAAALADMQRASNLRRRRLAGGRGGSGADPMIEAVGRAVASMGAAAEQLQRLSTAEALPSEMAALNELLRAQSEVRRREIQQQADGAGGSGSNRHQQDLSALFDRELARQQQTNYETPPAGERQETRPDETLERVGELARRQDELNRAQQELARDTDGASPEELRRRLERLTREQSELRRQTEELVRQLQQQSSDGGGQGATGGASSQDRQASRELQQAAREMQGAASELRRDNPAEASARSSRAAERLRGVEQRMRGSRPDERRRALGELQLESRQLADAQRRLAGETAARGADTADGARRRAVEQERLAERAARVEDGVRRLASSRPESAAEGRGALDEAAQDVERQRLSQRMRAAAQADRQAAAGGRNGARQEPGSGPGPGTRGDPVSADGSRREREEIASGLDRLADRLGAASGENEAAQQLGDALARVRRQREAIAALDRQLVEARKEAAGTPKAGEGGAGNPPGAAGQNGAPRAPWEEVRELLGELRRQDANTVPAHAEGFNPGRSAPGTEAWKQDFEAWDQLKVQLAGALERTERELAGRLRGQEPNDRLDAGGSQRVPERYAPAVERYFRELASGTERR